MGSTPTCKSAPGLQWTRPAPRFPAHGIRAMNRASDERAKDRRERERAEVQRHAEAMTALREFIARTAPAAD